MLVCDRDGAAAGCLVALRTLAPPVYDPGGPTVTLDDFFVARDEEWPSVGTALLTALQAIARRKRWHQLVVVGAAADLAKARFLESLGLSVASTWSVGTFATLPPPAP